MRSFGDNAQVSRGLALSLFRPVFALRSPIPGEILAVWAPSRPPPARLPLPLSQAIRAVWASSRPFPARLPLPLNQAIRADWALF